jgi:hypothetical protein
MMIAALPTAVHWTLVLHVYEPDTPSFFSRSHDAVIRVYDKAGSVIECGFSDDNIEKILRENCMRIFEGLL